MSSSTVTTIKERLGIVEVVSGYLELAKAGVNLKAKCPFHNEKTPSFTVSPARNSYYCFGCQAHGDIFSFVQQFEGLDFPGALRVLADKAGVPIVYEHSEQKDKRDRLYAILEAATLFFEQGLTENPRARDYLKMRGLSVTTTKLFRLGYAQPGWRDLKEHLGALHFSEREMEEAGLVKRGEKGLYDRFRGRIVFPIAEPAGRVVAFSGRIFDEAEKQDEAKYLNSPETPLFNKSAVLFGFDKAKLAIRRVNFSIVVEGQMDLVLSHQAGYGNTVALSGTALSPEQVAMLKRLSSNVVLALDADRAGVAASGRSADVALAAGMDVKIAALPEGKDPADMILADATLWKEGIKNSRHVVEFYLEMIARQGHERRSFRLNVSRVVLPFVARIENNIDRAHFVEVIARRLGVGEDAIWNELARLPQHPDAGASSPEKLSGTAISAAPVVPVSRKETLARLACAWLAYEGKDGQKIVTDDFFTRELKRIVGNEAFERYSAETTARDKLLFELEQRETPPQRMEQEMRDVLALLEEECLKERYSEALQALRLFEGGGDTEKVSHALTQCNELSRQLSELTKKIV